jgi:hypothetical protein
MRAGTIAVIVVGIFVVLGIAYWVIVPSGRTVTNVPAVPTGVTTQQPPRGGEVGDAGPPVGGQAQGTPAEREPIVVGDAITDDTVVIQPAADPVILPADPDTNTVTPIDDGTAAPATGAASPGAVQAPAATPIPPEELLTPANFDADAVRTLLAQSDQLSEDQRSSLLALVDGAVANPQTIESTLAAIRAALRLPPLSD